MRFRVAGLLLISCGAAFGQFVDLSGDWRISKDDNPQYAQAGFDDRAWGTVRLPWEVERPLGVYWLRKTVTMPATNAALTLAIGGVNESYEVYVNGARNATTPGFGTNDPPFFEPRVFPLAFDLPANTVVALRIWRPKNLVWIQPYLSKDYGPYVLADSKTAWVFAEESSMGRSRYNSLHIPAFLLSLLAAIYLVWNYFHAPEWPELVWLAVFCAVLGVLSALIVFVGFLRATSVSTIYNSGVALSCITLAEFAIRVLKIRAGFWRWLIWVVLPWSAVQLWLPIPISPAIFPSALCFFWGVRALRGERATRLAAFLIVVYAVVRLNIALNNLLGLGLFPTSFDVGNYRFPLAAAAGAAIAGMLIFDTLGRLLRDKSEKQRLAGEMQAAREIQQLMLAGAAQPSREYAVNAVYYPAQEVGGDFYRVLEDGDARLLVVGDVSGKGLKAAMLVSVMVGALRMTQDRTPASVLSALARALSGQLDGGFVTCCCARLEIGGKVRLANAGHLNPYRKGIEVEMEAGLPLGILPDASYTETSLVLSPGEQLTFLSDGVAEAANTKGELFGFDRTQEISWKAAAEIADAAKAWGQNDDITVVTVRRVE